MSECSEVRATFSMLTERLLIPSPTEMRSKPKPLRNQERYAADYDFGAVSAAQGNHLHSHLYLSRVGIRRTLFHYEQRHYTNSRFRVSVFKSCALKLGVENRQDVKNMLKLFFVSSPSSVFWGREFGGKINNIPHPSFFAQSQNYL